MLAFALALAGCDSTASLPDPHKVGMELLPKADALCTAAFASGQGPGTPAPGSVQGPVVGFGRDAEGYEFSQPWYPMGYALFSPNHRALPPSADAVRAIVCELSTYNEVGRYQPDNIPAVRTDWDVRVLRWPSGEQVASKVFRGPDPPEKKEAGKDTKLLTGGSPPQFERTRWLEALIAN